MRQILYEKLIRYIVENQDRFYRMAYSYTGNKEDALDAVQNAVCKALEAYESIKNADAVRTWFYRILTNECFALIKKRNKIVLFDDYGGQAEVYCEQAYGQGEDIRKELNKLEPDTRAIIILRYFEELSLKEVSGIMNLNLSTVKTKLYRGLKTLRENIQEADLWEN